MEPFTVVTGYVAPLDRNDVDTDQIIPKQFLKRIERTGFGEFLFFDWARLPDGSPNPDFVLCQPYYREAKILVTGRNFGCGSSREHAPWALSQFGIRVIIAPSFADIFRNNCYQNGMLPLELPQDVVDTLMARAIERPGYEATVDLERQEVRDHNGVVTRFAIDPFVRERLLHGLDDIGLTLQHEHAIAAYERRREQELATA
ncbi:MAG TPA: 3-isopropylmalate dehydratase small subunit [Dehalococcoidia bacterium]|nr:3-isopropylmalate dehydratase small subunit [Dehalococcoidia bacterium]